MLNTKLGAQMLHFLDNKPVIQSIRKSCFYLFKELSFHFQFFLFFFFVKGLYLFFIHTWITGYLIVSFHASFQYEKIIVREQRWARGQGWSFLSAAQSYPRKRSKNFNTRDFRTIYNFPFCTIKLIIRWVEKVFSSNDWNYFPIFMEISCTWSEEHALDSLCSQLYYLHLVPEK